jgi:hypothetical protein
MENSSPQAGVPMLTPFTHIVDGVVGDVTFNKISLVHKSSAFNLCKRTGKINWHFDLIFRYYMQTDIPMSIDKLHPRTFSPSSPDPSLYEQSSCPGRLLSLPIHFHARTRSASCLRLESVEKGCG